MYLIECEFIGGPLHHKVMEVTPTYEFFVRGNRCFARYTLSRAGVYTFRGWTCRQTGSVGPRPVREKPTPEGSVDGAIRT